MIHVFIENYDDKGRPLKMRLELDDKLRPLVLKVLERLADRLERQQVEVRDGQVEVKVELEDSAPF